MECVILAGGKGSRLKPFTDETPKPLVPVGDKPIIEYLIASLKKHGITKIHLTINHLGEKIQEALGQGERFDLELIYHREEKPLSTAAPIKQIDNLPEI